MVHFIGTTRRIEIISRYTLVWGIHFLHRIIGVKYATVIDGAICDIGKAIFIYCIAFWNINIFLHICLCNDDFLAIEVI